MTSWLSKNHEVRVVTSFPYYPEWEKREGDRGFKYRKEESEGATVYRCPIWVSKKMNSLRRLIHLASFAISSVPVFLWSLVRWRPDVVFTVAPTLMAAPFVLGSSKLLGVKSWLHVQDFEVDVMLGMGSSSQSGKSYYLKKLALGLEGVCMKMPDRVSSISPAMVEKAAEKGVLSERIRSFPNWVDLDFFQPIEKEGEVRREFGYEEDDVIVLYAGNIGIKQGLDLMPDLVRGALEYPKLKFLIVGEGVYRDTLEKDLAFAADAGKVKFLTLQPLDQLVKIMTMADLHLVLQRKEVKDLVLPSKLTTILSMGGNVLMTAPAGSALANLVENHPGVGFLKEPGDQDSLVEFLNEMRHQPLTKPNEKARAYAEAYLGRDSILEDFERDLKELVN